MQPFYVRVTVIDLRWPKLEVKTQRELKHAGAVIARIRDGRDDLSEVRRLEVGIQRQREVRVVEDVVRLGAKLEAYFFCNGEILGEREIGIREMRTSKLVAGADL